MSLIPPCEEQCEWHWMTRMTEPICAANYAQLNKYTDTHSVVQRKKYPKNISNMWKLCVKKNERQICRWPFMGWREKEKKSGEYIG